MAARQQINAPSSTTPNRKHSPKLGAGVPCAAATASAVAQPATATNSSAGTSSSTDSSSRDRYMSIRWPTATATTETEIGVNGTGPTGTSNQASTIAYKSRPTNSAAERQRHHDNRLAGEPGNATLLDAASDSAAVSSGADVTADWAAVRTLRLCDVAGSAFGCDAEVNRASRLDCSTVTVSHSSCKVRPYSPI